MTQPADYYKATSLCYNKHRNMTEKNYDYYLKKTKTDAERRQKEHPTKNSKAETTALGVWLLTITFRRAIVALWRLALIGLAVTSLVFGCIAYSNLKDGANLPLIILFAIIHVGIIIFTVASFWHRGLWAVTVFTFILGIFAFMAPFYSDDCSYGDLNPTLIGPCRNLSHNFYGQELNY